MTMESMGPADFAAISGNNGFGGNNCSWMWIILLFVLFGGYGYGNRGYAGEALTRSDLAAGFNFQDVNAQLRDLVAGNFGIQKDILTQTNMLGASLAESRYAQQHCCCETNRNIDSVKYENAQNTCAIVNAIKDDGEKTRALMVENTIQALRDRVAEKDQQLQTANFQISQVAQTANIVDALRTPAPIPAYLSCSPYQSNYYATNGFHSGCSSCGL